MILDIKVDFEDREVYELLKCWGKEQVVLKDSLSACNLSNWSNVMAPAELGKIKSEWVESVRNRNQYVFDILNLRLLEVYVNMVSEKAEVQRIQI